MTVFNESGFGARPGAASADPRPAERPQGRQAGWRLAAALSLSLLLTACAEPAPTGSGQAGGERARAPKTLRIGMGNEPTGTLAGWGHATGVGTNDMNFIFHAGLTLYDPASNNVPWIARKAPQIADGDWKVAPDGSMELTWKLRPDVKWHDGTPLTAKDFVLGIEIRRDPALAISQTGVEQLAGAAAPDADTLVVTYKAPYIYANISTPGQLRAVPSHIMEDAYRRGEGEALLNLPYWHTEFVGLGPYRLVQWNQGSSMEAAAFDEYFLGRPQIDRLAIRFIPDTNVNYVTLVAGEIDLIPMGAFQADAYARIKQEYEGAGQGKALAVFSGARTYRFQMKYPELPWAGDIRIRRALTHMLDREELGRNLTGGLFGATDIPVSPASPLYSVLKGMGYPTFPHDPALAQRLLAESGWQKGADGMYRSGAGQTMPLTVLVRNTGSFGANNTREGSAITDAFRRAGIDATQDGSGGGGVLQREQEHTNRGLFALPLRESHESFVAFASAQVGRAPQWNGGNYGGWSNPEYDRLFERSTLSFDASERNRLLSSAIKVLGDEAANVYFFYDMGQQSVVFRNGIRGPVETSPEQFAITWNVHTWEID